MVAVASRFHQKITLGPRVCIRLVFARMLASPDGPAPHACGRSSQPERSGRITTPPLDDERNCGAGFLPKRTHGLSNWTGLFPERQGNPGTGAGMETDEEVALSPDDSEPGRARRMRMNWAGSLRRELSRRAEQYARTHALPHCLSYGQPSTVCFEQYCNDSRHGNFLSSTYTTILRNPNWRRRLQKVHSQGRKSLPRQECGVWRELDACTSSDALLDECILLSRRVQRWRGRLDA